MTRRGLGRGLGALIPGAEDASTAGAAVSEIEAVADISQPISAAS